MAKVKRPGFTEDSFLSHLFSPKKNPLPTGIRKQKLAFSKGRTRARVAAFNRMSNANQQMLKMAGLRDKYLTGDASLKDARGKLRETAVAKRIAKPLRRKAGPVTGPVRTKLDDMIAAHVIKTVRDAGKVVDARRVDHYSPYMSDDDKLDMGNRPWDYAKIKAYAGDKRNEIVIDDRVVNPLWYHPS